LFATIKKHIYDFDHYPQQKEHTPDKKKKEKRKQTKIADDSILFLKNISTQTKTQTPNKQKTNQNNKKRHATLSSVSPPGSNPIAKAITTVTSSDKRFLIGLFNKLQF